MSAHSVKEFAARIPDRSRPPREFIIETEYYGHTRQSLRSVGLRGAFVARMGGDLDHCRPACEESSCARAHFNPRGVLATEDPDRVAAVFADFPPRVFKRAVHQLQSCRAMDRR